MSAQNEDEYVGALPLCGIIRPVTLILWYLQLHAGHGNPVRFFTLLTIPFFVMYRNCSLVISWRVSRIKILEDAMNCFDNLCFKFVNVFANSNRISFSFF